MSVLIHVTLTPETTDIFCFEALTTSGYGGLFKLLTLAYLLHQFRVVALAFEILQCLLNLVSVLYNYSYHAVCH